MSKQITMHPNILSRLNQTANTTKLDKAVSNSTKIYNYPYISGSDFKQTLENWEAYRQAYNKSLEPLNQAVTSYNELVNAMIKAKKPKQPKAANLAFSKANNPLFVKDYNALVEQENKALDCPVYKKREYKPIRWQSKPYFKAIIGFYSSQIKRNNLKRLQANRNTTRPLEKIVIDSKKLSEAKKESILLNECHKTTFQRHVKRFREAGMLVDYTFINSNKPIYCNLNPQILCISDHKNEKTQKTENQQVKEKRVTKCIDNNHTTRTIINKIEMKADKAASKRSSHALTDNNLILQEHQQNKNLEKTNQAQKISQTLRESIIDPLQFAKQLHAQSFINYQPLEKDLLFYEANYGLLNKGEFRQLVIQDVLKRLSTLWKNSNYSVGSWVNALKIIDENWFITFTGLEFNKLTIYNQLDEYFYRIKEVKRWLSSNKQFTILYPSLYFEPHRKHSFQGGWQFTQQWWTSHIAKNPKKAQKKRIANKKAAEIKKYNQQKKRMQTKVRQVIAQKCTLAQLFDYLDTNGFPESIIDMVPETIAYYEKI